MSHTKTKDQRRVQEKIRGQEPLHGQADHLIKNGQPTKGLGRVGLPIPQMLDLDQAGGKSLVPVHLLVMQCPALQKHRAVVHGMLQATECPSKVPPHHGSDRAQIPNHHGTKIDSRSKSCEYLFAKGRREDACNHLFAKGRRERKEQRREISKGTHRYKNKRQKVSQIFLQEEPKSRVSGRRGFRLQIH